MSLFARFVGQVHVYLFLRFKVSTRRTPSNAAFDDERTVSPTGPFVLCSREKIDCISEVSA
jgi:hypothetical protein